MLYDKQNTAELLHTQSQLSALLSNFYFDV